MATLAGMSTEERMSPGSISAISFRLRLNDSADRKITNFTE